MRSCLFSGLFAGLLIAIPAGSTAQSNRNSGGVTVSRDTKLTAGDEITVAVKEDRDPLLRTVVTDTGEVELNGLGRVYIAGKSSVEAEGGNSGSLSPVSAVVMLQKRGVISGSGSEHPGLHAAGGTTSGK